MLFARWRPSMLGYRAPQASQPTAFRGGLHYLATAARRRLLVATPVTVLRHAGRRLAHTATQGRSTTSSAARATPKSAGDPYSEGLREAQGLQLILPAICVVGSCVIIYSAAQWDDPMAEKWDERTRRRVNTVYSYLGATIAGCAAVSVKPVLSVGPLYFASLPTSEIRPSLNPARRARLIK
eukprot:COSAG02_NODE_8442_length_2569_cov_1.587854_2_plen_182_part_00